MKNDTKSIKIAANLALNIVETSVNREVTETENVSKNYFMISDNSYSMSSMITTLKANLKDKIRNTIKDWDTITLARFQVMDETSNILRFDLEKLWNQISLLLKNKLMKT